MFQLIRIVSVAMAFVAIGGCSHFAENNPTAEFPIAEQFPQIYQGKLRSAAHWSLIAQNEAKLVSEALPNTLVGYSFDPVHESPNNSDFAVSYHHMLTQGLLANGMAVKDKNGDLDLSYHIQVVEHSNRFQSELPAGFFTGLTAAGYFIAHAVDHWSNPELAAIPFLIGLDIFNFNNSDSAWWRTINTEIVLTTAVRRGEQILYSNSSVYYLHSTDRALYDGGSVFEVVSAGGK